MTRYRFDLLDASGKVYSKRTIECDDAEAVLDQANALLAEKGTSGVEVWDGPRMVHCFKNSAGQNRA